VPVSPGSGILIHNRCSNITSRDRTRNKKIENRPAIQNQYAQSLYTPDEALEDHPAYSNSYTLNPTNQLFI
jgi:hypothetical protein